jgi:hypothetical protein
MSRKARTSSPSLRSRWQINASSISVSGASIVIGTSRASWPNSAAETKPTPAPEATISLTASRPSASMAGFACRSGSTASESQAPKRLSPFAKFWRRMVGIRKVQSLGRSCGRLRFKFQDAGNCRLPGAVAQPKRFAENSAADGTPRPAMKPAIQRAVAGASVSPRWPWPKA